MRFIVIPLSTKRCMVYCQQTLPLASKNPRIDDRLARRASNIWEKWKVSDTKWKVAIVRWADKMLERISYEEWSLKTIPAQSAILRRKKSFADKSGDGNLHQTNRQREDAMDGADMISNYLKNKFPAHHVESIPVIYPGIMPASEISVKLRQLADKGLTHHWKYFWWSAVGAPLTLPVALIPLIPNIPGFYLLFRAWSNWKAYEGGRHLDYLIKDNHLDFQTQETLDTLFRQLIKPAGAQPQAQQQLQWQHHDRSEELNEEKQREVQDQSQAWGQLNGQDNSVQSKEFLLVDEDDIDKLVSVVGAKEMAGELHRAVRQVKRSIRQEQVKEQK